MSDQPETPSRKNADIFPDSRWTLVVRAQSAPGTSAFDALNSLCSIYWQPIYAFIRRSGLSSEEAEDLTQGYLQNLMDRNYLSQASPEKGKLRAFLLADLKLYLSNERRRANSQKRGGGKLFIPIDRQWAEEYYTHEPADEVSPADLWSNYPDWPAGNVSLEQLGCGVKYLSKSEATSSGGRRQGVTRPEAAA